MKRKIAITIVGTGYVGLTVGICLSSLGYKVICVDQDEDKIKKLKKGKIPFYEPGLNKVLKRCQKNIEFTINLKESIKKGEVIFICVGTPSKKDGQIDMSCFKGVIKKVAQLLEGYKVIVHKSTVPVGTGDWAKREIKKYYKGEFSIVSNPEFLSEGSAVKNFLNPNRIILGVEDEKSKKIMLSVYRLIKAPKIITDIKTAELIKYTANAFLSTRISFINEIANICEKVGGDVKKVIEGVGYDERIGHSFLNPGIGYGGSCFPKDIDGFIDHSKRKGYDFKLLKAVSIVNKNQQRKFARKIINLLKNIKGRTVCVWGLSFKPNTGDIRKSPAIEIIKILQKKRIKIQAYDPVAMSDAKKEILSKNIKFCKTPLLSACNADVLVLTTEWSEFSKINMKKIKKLMRQPYILDGRNQFDPQKIKRLGFYYEGVGRK